MSLKTIYIVFEYSFPWICNNNPSFFYIYIR